MKRKELIAHLAKAPLPVLKNDVLDLEKKIQAQKMAVAFGKSKQVRITRQLKRDLARSLTIANQKLQEQLASPATVTGKE